MVGELPLLALLHAFFIEEVQQRALRGKAQRHHGLEGAEGRLQNQVLVVDGLFYGKFFFFQEFGINLSLETTI